MPANNQINVDPATSGTPQAVAANLISSKLYDAVNVADGAGDTLGVSTNPLRNQWSWQNRVETTFVAIGAAAITTEALASLTPGRGGAGTGTAATSHSPTPAKNFMLLSMTVWVRNTTTAAVVPVEFYLRYSTGTLAASSPILGLAATSNPSATLNTVGQANVQFGPGLIIPAGVNFGVSYVSRNTTNGQVGIVLSGFEYTP